MKCAYHKSKRIVENDDHLLLLLSITHYNGGIKNVRRKE